MKKYFFLTLAITVVFFGALSTVSAQLTYTPLEPIQGLTLDTTSADSFPALLNQIFMTMFSLAALLAVVMLTVGGIQYMVSSAVTIKKEGIVRAKAALYGLLILAGSFLILYTINPKLIEFRLTLLGVDRQVSPGGTAQQVSQNAGSSSCTHSSTSGSSSYLINSPCANAITVKLNQIVNGNNGVALQNVSQGGAVLVLNPNVPIDSAESKAAISKFLTGCQNVGGDVENWPPASGSGATYICIKDRQL